MKKILVLAIIILFGFSITAQADELRIIKLRDGSILRGYILSLQDGVYTIKTNNIGTVQVSDKNVLSIQDKATFAATGAALRSMVQTESRSPAQGDIMVNHPGMMGGNPSQMLSNPMFQQMQNRILNDPNIMMDIEKLSQDEELMRIMSDPTVLDALMTMDPEKIEGNEKIQYLMQHPDMLRIIQNIYGTSNIK